MLLALSACGGDGGDEPRSRALPACRPPTSSLTAPAGAALPPGALVTDVVPEGPLVRIRAFVPDTPRRIRGYYESEPRYRVLDAEDEIVEAELLVTDGTHRTSVIAKQSCQGGSILGATVAPELSPAPSTSSAPPPPR